MARIDAIQVLKEAAALKERKSQDYQGSIWSEEDYFPFAEKSYIHMLWTKMLRIRSVAEQEDTNFESLTDSLDDMINYSAMMSAYIQNKQMKEDEDSLT